MSGMVRKSKSIEAMYMGPEPSPETTTLETTSDLVQAYSWYNYFHSSDDAKKWTIKYNPEIEKELKAVPDFELRTIGWTFRLQHQGFELPSETLEKVKSKISQLISRYKAVEEMKRAAKLDVENPENAIKLKEADDTLYVLNDKIEQYLDGDLKDFVPYDWLIRVGADQFTGQYILDNCEWFEEGEELLDEDDLPFIESIKAAAEKLAEAKRIQRKKRVELKPRKKRAVKPEKVVSKLAYLKEHKELGLKSVPAPEIIGASEIWLYNTEKRILTVLRGGPMTVRGSTIFDFDEKKSVAKKIRKPEEVIPDLSKMRVAARMGKVMDSIKTKPCYLSGRCNDQTIIMKVFK